ncbi:MAG: cupredoxin domain-containing protein [Candidatus Saccharimonadales bacterium]
MSKPVVGGIIVLLILVAGGGLLLANHKSSDTSSGSSSSTAMSDDTMKNSSGNSSTTVATTSVTIKDMAFSPANIGVKVGDTVTWTNNDSVAHTVTETDGQTGPKSEDIEPGKSFVYTFDKAGTYKYDCSIHPSMTGSVTVTAR